MGRNEKLPVPDYYYETVLNKLRGRLAREIPEANIALFGPPPLRGVGRAGGWMVMIEDRGDLGSAALQREVENLTRMGNDGIDVNGTPIVAPKYDLKLVSSAKTTSELPENGRSKIVVAEIDDIIHFRIFDRNAQMILETDEKKLTEQAKQAKDAQKGGHLPQGFQVLRKQLTPLWSASEVEDAKKPAIVGQIKSILGTELVNAEGAKPPPAVAGLASVFRANIPQIFLDVDRTACMLKGVEMGDVFLTLQAYLGSLYVNDFNRFGRTWQVIVQAMAKYRDQKDDITRLQVRNRSGTMVPLGAVSSVREINGPLVLTRYNMYAAASINGSAAPGISSGSAIHAMEEVSNRELPRSMGIEWTEMAYLELLAGNTAIIVFGFSIVMVFLVLAAQFESWAMPLAVILSVPLCMLSALLGVTNAKLLGVNNISMDINIFTQIGLVVLVGLASKNSILIVQFAKLIRGRGKPIREATLEACRLRLRPIIMTSMAFVLGVVPLLYAHGAGAEMRQSLGVAVFSGMIGVTFFGVMLTPVFFYVIDSVAESHIFRNPMVRRVGKILLMVLLPVILIPKLFRLASRRRPEPRANAVNKTEEPELIEHK